MPGEGMRTLPEIRPEETAIAKYSERGRTGLTGAPPEFNCGSA